MRIPLLRFNQDSTPIAWWEWLFYPLFIVLLGFVMIPAIPLAGLYFWLYPERHANLWDLDENPAHERRVKQWRAAYGRLSRPARLRRACRKTLRRRNAALVRSP